MRKTANKSISLEPKLVKLARQRATARRQSFSGYIASLIDRDLMRPLPPTVNGEGKAA